MLHTHTYTRTTDFHICMFLVFVCVLGVYVCKRDRFETYTTDFYICVLIVCVCVLFVFVYVRGMGLKQKHTQSIQNFVSYLGG